MDALGHALEKAAAAFTPSHRLDHDPVGLVRAQPQHEREVVAHVAGLLAYGAVAQIRRAVGEVLAVVGPDVTESVRDWRPGTFEARRPAWVYRMTRAADIDGLLLALGAQLRAHGTLERAWVAHAGDAIDAPDCIPALERYVAALRASAQCERRGFRFLTPDPATGSAAKRWLLLLRWLVRRDDGADLGLWSAPRPSQLLLPLDTHLVRHVVALGLSTRRTADLRMAREATAVLRRIDPDDPLRFDMVLCHMGIAGDCRHRFDAPTCSGCSLAGVCRWTAG